jgi:predicted alpha/beta superfamily hydrolase
MRVAAALLLILLPLPLSAQGRFHDAVSIGTVDSIRSATLDEVRPYLVYTPPSYDDTTSAPQGYPVLYLLDGDAHFHSVTGLVQILGTGVNGTFVVPEMIVVAIPNTNRTRDLTPTHTDLGFDGKPTPAFAESGGNAPFFDFLTRELIPEIDARYRTMPYRVLVGHSFGGITVLNALYTIPRAFDAYVAIDPSLWWDHETLLRRAKGYFESARLDHRALYVAQANTLQPDDTLPNPHFSAIAQFDAVMRAYDRSGIRYAFRYYPEDDHGSVPLIAEYDALRFVFDGYHVPLGRVPAEPALLTRHFEDVSERLGATFRPSEGMVMLLANVALQADTAHAIELGEMALAMYPESRRAPVFLGDRWAERGDVDRARRYYEQALARSPGNAAIRRKLDALGRAR